MTWSPAIYAQRRPALVGIADQSASSTFINR
jgi:hypothetical protein